MSKSLEECREDELAYRQAEADEAEGVDTRPLARVHWRSPRAVGTRNWVNIDLAEAWVRQNERDHPEIEHWIEHAPARK